jgi:SAM-dependent methyltransferase
MNQHFVRRSSCPACQARDSVELYRASYTAPPISDYLVSFYSCQGGVEFELLEGNDYRLQECQGCGLMYQSEIPNPALSLKLYEEWINPQKAFEVYEAPRDLAYFLTLTDEIANLIRHFNIAPAGLRVLDFGMGWGFWCRAAIGLGCQAHGVELSPTRIEYAARRGIQVLRWEEIPDHQFDVINADQVFEHIPEPLETLRHLRRALKPGGFIKISVPDGRDVKRNLGRLDWEAPAGSAWSLNPVAPLEHINCFTRRSLIMMAARADLKPAFVPRRLVICPSAGVVSRAFAKKVIKSLMGRWARLFVKRGTTVLLESAS